MKRSAEKELLDLGNYTAQEYEDCLIKLERVGRLLGGDRASFHAFRSLPKPPASILEIGCGGGFFSRKLAEKYPKATVVGTDLNPDAIKFASNANAPLPNLRYSHSTPNESFDVITCTLVCHHMSDQELIEFLKWAYNKSNHAVIINDLHRSFLAWIGFALISPFLLNNRLVFHDGLLSIRRAFTKKEWMRYLAEASIENYRIRWHWPFRWTVTIFK